MLESLARTYFRRAGIRVEAQVHIGGVGYVDLLLDGRLIVELDGRHHGEWAQVKKDQRRNNRSVILGYVVLRYYYADVVHEPTRMVAEVLAVLAGMRAPGATSRRADSWPPAEKDSRV
jgi:very-short-patch-repair endonuclease